MDRGVHYLQPVRQVSPLVRRHGLDALIVLAALAGALEVALRDDPDEPTTSMWFAVPAVVAVVLVLLGRRRFPFAAPATFWALSEKGCSS